MTNSKKPRVLNKHHGNLPKTAVYIGRPSIWGNPFIIGQDGSRQDVIEKYRKMLLHPENQWLVDLARKELVGKDLVCFCAPQACHGDVLLEIANSKG